VSAPDLIEPIYGWRAWRIARTVDGLRLSSIIYDDLWAPNAAFAAICHARSHSTCAPDATCACGVYASRSSSDATRYATGRNDSSFIGRAIGIVALWGLVFAGSGGWRASFGYPKRLWVREPLEAADPEADQLAAELAVYGAPVTLWRPGTAIATEDAPATLLMG
jgi:hypothetical protein